MSDKKGERQIGTLKVSLISYQRKAWNILKHAALNDRLSGVVLNRGQQQQRRRVMNFNGQSVSSARTWE